MRRRCLAVALSAILLAACTTPATRNQSSVVNVPGASQLEVFVTALPGRFLSATRLDQPEAGVMMAVNVREIADDAIALEFSEQQEARQRGFVLVLERNSSLPFIEGQFTPVQADGTLSTRTCPMRFRLLQGLLSGETDPLTCRFGDAENSVGLLKEVALTGNQIIIADQLLGPGQSADDAPDVIRLHRMASFRANVRSRESSEAAWRVAEPLDLAAGASAYEAVDAAGMGLDVAVRLRLVQGLQPGDPLLYLQLNNTSTGAVMGQAWADAQARRIGLALDQAQIDLIRQ
ncbi:MAG TPA: hypothetical protein VKO38_07195 [Wenzhouxiangella sp.]|nr:hypothetical protein [Wenzhouxiangella sp.]